MCQTSHSTDKLALLTNTLKDVPSEVLAKVSEFTLDWKPVNGITVPVVTIKFK